MDTMGFKKGRTDKAVGNQYGVILHHLKRARSTSHRHAAPLLAIRRSSGISSEVALSRGDCSSLSAHARERA
eukprot:831741-Pleurochrysis_carterae.AAC.1